MPVTTIDTQPDAKRKRFVIVVSRYNDYLTRQMLDLATQTLVEHGAAEDDILVIWVQGSDETPLAAEWSAKHESPDAIIALGVVVEGETAHADIITRHCSDMFARISSEYDLPVINGIISARSTAQAVARAEIRGEPFAMAAIHMAQLKESLQSRNPTPVS